MNILKERLNTKLKNKNLTIYQLNKLINYNEGDLYKMINNKMSFSENVRRKILPILEISEDEFLSWVVADKYNQNILFLANKIRQQFHENKRKSILTTKIDELLKIKKLSRTELSKKINYSQSGLNKMITNKMSFSGNVRKKILPILEISEDEFLSWIVADKYNQNILFLANKIKE